LLDPACRDSARWVVVPDAGHFIALEHPAAFERGLRDVYVQSAAPDGRPPREPFINHPDIAGHAPPLTFRHEEVNMFRRFFLQGIAALLLCLSMGAQARAVPVVGTLDVTGAVRVTPTSLDFLPPVGGGGGVVNVGPTSTGLFAPISGTQGQVLDIPYAAGSAQPGFLTAGAAFDLTALEAGAFKSTKCAASRPAAGQTCTPEGTALSLVNTTDHSCSVSVSLRGNFRISSGEETPYAGVITFQFADRNFQQLLAGFAAGDFPVTTFSASFAPAGQPQQ
jgi:hypothetical protein